MLFNRISSLFILLLINFSVESKSSPYNCHCGEVAEEEINGRVMGGSILRLKGHPFLAMITYLDSIICGGSVVGPNHILTAAHCLQDVAKIELLRVLLGVHDRIVFATNVKTYEVKEVIKHAGFKVIKNRIPINDIALLRVDRIMFNDYIKPICLPFNFDVNKLRAAAVAGWGATMYKGQTSRMPRATLLTLLSNSQCQRSDIGNALGKVRGMYKMTLCAYRQSADACQGDSGGPLYVQNGKEIIFQIGIVSFGVKCGIIGKPGLYTRLGNYLQWLRKHLEGGYCKVFFSPDDRIRFQIPTRRETCFTNQ